MSLAIDIILVAVFVLQVIFGWKRGLTGVVLGIARIAISLILALLLGPTIGKSVGDGGALSGILGYIAVFVVTYVVATIIMAIVKKIKIPIISTLDKLFGILIGVVLGIITISLISVPLHSLLSTLSEVSGKSSFEEVYNNSYIFKFVAESNIFGFIKDVLT